MLEFFNFMFPSVNQKSENIQLDRENMVIKNLLKDKEDPEEFKIEYNEDLCCDGADLPQDSF